MGMGFQFEQHRLGLWDLSWDLKKNTFLGNGIRTPPFATLYIEMLKRDKHGKENLCAPKIS